jgi:uncharacterized protein YrrD
MQSDVPRMFETRQFEGNSGENAVNHSGADTFRQIEPMLRSIRQLYGNELEASDGKIGHVKDFYFDDQRWAVRYVVVDTGEWLSGRVVLISPHAFGDFYQNGNRLPVNMTRKQIQEGPGQESDLPVSRQYEEEYYQYYGLPNYWNGAELWGGASYPVVPSQILMRGKDNGPELKSQHGGDPHLQSTKALKDYHIQTSEGVIGHVTDFIVDEKSWAICHVVVETGHWFQGREIVISPKYIERISYEESKVFVSVAKDAIEDAAEYRMPRARYQGSNGRP